MKKRDKQSPSPQKEALLNVHDVAALLNTSARNVYSGVSRGLLPRGAKIPGLGVRWRRADIDAFLAAAFPPAPEAA